MTSLEGIESMTCTPSSDYGPNDLHGEWSSKWIDSSTRGSMSRGTVLDDLQVWHR